MRILRVSDDTLLPMVLIQGANGSTLFASLKVEIWPPLLGRRFALPPVFEQTVA